MPLLGGFRLGRWFGFPVRIDYSWFLVAALVVWTFSASEFPRLLRGYAGSTYLAMGVAAALLFFLSVLLHELAHAVVARTRGVTVESITLFVFGGIAQAREEAKRPLDEFLLTAAGPLSSLLIAGAFHAARLGAEAVGLSPPVSTVFGFLAFLNLILAVFNMIPGFPLDGGRIFRSIVWAATGDMARATRWATWGGRIFGGTLILTGLLLLASGSLLGGLWAAFIGWFLMNAATTSFRQFEYRRLLSRVPVWRVMTPEPRRIAADTTIERAISDHFLRGRDDAYPVDLNGIVLGLIDTTRAAGVPAPLRASTTVAQVMRPIYELASVGPGESLADALVGAEPGVGSLLVLEDQRLVGLLDVREVGGWVQRMYRLGLISRDGEDWSAGSGAGAEIAPGRHATLAEGGDVAGMAAAGPRSRRESWPRAEGSA